MAGKKKAALTPEEKLQQVLVPENEQPYKVPDNWCWVRLGEINKYNSTNVDPSNQQETLFELYSVPSSANDYPEILLGGDIGSTKQKVEKNDVLLCKINPRINRVWKVSGHTDNVLVASSEWIIVRNHELNSDYLVYCFKAPYFREYMLSNVSGVGGSLMRAQPKYVRTYPVPIPPVYEQKRIVSYINNWFSKLDEAKGKIQLVLDGFEKRKAAILHKAFTGELTAKWREEHGVGMESWEELTLNDVAEYKKGPFGSSITKAMFVPKGYNTYKVYEQGNAIRKTVDYGNYYIPEEKYKELKNFSVSAGDIIISCAGTIGEVFKIPKIYEAGVINQALMRVRLFPNIEEQFFVYYFGEVLKKDVVIQSNGTAIKNIPPFKIMKAMKIYLPTLLEQSEIIHIVNNLLRKEQQVKQSAEKALEQIDLIKKSILAKAFRGELGTNNPEEESALELVKKALAEK